MPFIRSCGAQAEEGEGFLKGRRERRAVVVVGGKRRVEVVGVWRGEMV